MSAVSIPSPGSEFGPCVEPCQHSDCLAMRVRAIEPCTVCGRPIGYATRYYSDDRMGTTVGYVHAVCAEEVGS